MIIKLLKSAWCQFNKLKMHCVIKSIIQQVNAAQFKMTIAHLFLFPACPSVVSVLHVSSKLFNAFQHSHTHTQSQHSPALTPSSLPRQQYSAHCHGNAQSPCSHNPFPSHNEYLTRFTLGGLLYGGWVCGNNIFCTKHTL